MPDSSMFTLKAIPLFVQSPSTILFCCISLLVSCGFYRLYFHPLSRFPGPRFAALTGLWLHYVELVQKVSFTDKLKELHARYGDIVRTGPNELHFSRPSAYNEIYSGSHRWDKDGAVYHSMGLDNSLFTTLSYREAKERKDILQPLFSRRSILGMQWLIKQNVDKFCGALAKNDRDERSSDLFLGFRCFTIDTITSFCFARSIHALDAPGFHAPVAEVMEHMLPLSLVFKKSQTLKHMVDKIPPWLSVILAPRMSALFYLIEILREQIAEVVKNPEALEEAPHPIIYHALLRPPPNKGRPVTSPKVLLDEAQALMFGATDTTGNAMMMGVFYILEHPDVLEKLQGELKEAWPDLDQAPDLEAIEKLPYLTAVLKEILRCNPGVVSPLSRVVPPSGANISGAFIPGGTTVGMAGIFVHTSESVFDQANEFLPERWLQEDSHSLDTWLVAFSRGPRSCIGVNLAWCELYLMFATIFRKFDMTLDGTKASDLGWKDCFVPYFYGRHLQVFCKPVEE